MRSARKATTRVGAVALAAAFAVVTPGFGTVTATAQEEGAETRERPAWAPQGNPGSPPEDSGEPDEIYVQEIACVQPSTDGHQVLGADELTRAPDAQRLLQISKVHEFVRNNSKHGKIGWNDQKDEPLKVAVIDTGVNAKHSFFGGRVTGGGDYVGGDNPKDVENAAQDENGLLDCDGHGTQVAGIIGADPQGDGGRTDIAFRGFAPDVEIVSIRQSSQNYRAETEDEKENRLEERERRKERARAERERKAREAEIKRKQDELEREQRELEQRQNEDTDSSAARQENGEDEQDPRGQGTGAGNQGTLAQAIVRAANSGAQVINMSVDACRPNFGDGKTLAGDETRLRAAVRYAVEEKDAVVVTAAGNVGGSCEQNDKPEPIDPNNPDGPKRMPDPNQPPTIVTPPWFSEDLLAVAAVDKTGAVADFSMRGPWVNIAAPGTDITSVDPAGGSTETLVNIMYDGEGEGTPIQGTSFAAPYVAGLAVLVRQMHPELNAREVMNRIMWTAQHPGARDGRDQFVGYGLINPMAALTTEEPIEPQSVSSEFSSDMPPMVVEDETPTTVALLGTVGGVSALLITMFVVRTVKRRREEPAEA